MLLQATCDRRVTRIGSWNAGVLLLAAWLCVLPPLYADVARHVESLATLHAVSGSEAQALAYIRTQLGENVTVDNTGSLTATFGRGGSQRILVAAGIDEPGYVVSAVDGEGYLRLQRIADPSPHYQFDRFFLGQPVSIRTRSGAQIDGSVAAPAVHFDSSRTASYRASNTDGLFVDIGAGSRADVSTAGVQVLDTVALEKRFIRLGPSKASAPWISSRAGAAVLLDLAQQLTSDPPAGEVTLAFVTQQYRFQQGLLRVLQRSAAERVILLRPAGGSRLGIAPLSGASTAWADELLSTAEENGLAFERGASSPLNLSPFGPAEVFGDSDQAAALAIATEHTGTPVEVVDLDMLDQIGRLLAAVTGTRWTQTPAGGAPPRGRHGAPAPSAEASREAASPLIELIEELVEIHGVSKSEGSVRKAIQERLPSWAKAQSFIDERGNLIVAFGDRSSPQAVFIAHMDEIGFAVERIDSSGGITAKPVGGILDDLFAWHPVVLQSPSGPVAGIMKNSGQIDLGAGSIEDVKALGVAAGSPATVPKRFRRLLGERITARSLDDRIGCAVLLTALKRLNRTKRGFRESSHAVWLVFSVEEETGLLGATFTAERIGPLRVYAVDSFVTSDSPLEDRRTGYARLGEGFVIRAIDNSGISPRNAVERVAERARRQQIPVQYGVTAGGNDGSRFVSYGAANVPLSWPLRYAHTAAEVADLRDVEALAQIVTALLEQELSGGNSR